MDFDARDRALAPAADPATGHPLTPARVDPEVLGQVGETFAGSLFSVQQRLAELRTLAPLAQQVFDAALAEVARLEQLGVQLQGIARALGGIGADAAETFDLAAAARQAIAGWSATAARRGIAMVAPTEPVAVFAIPAVVEQLLDLAVELALRLGRAVAVEAAVQGVPPHPMIVVRIERFGAEPGDALHELQWLLLTALARASGLAPQRQSTAGRVLLTIGFPAAAQAGELDAPRSAAELPRTSLAAGRQVLVLEPREIARVQAHGLLHEAGMVVDAAGNFEQARSVLRDRTPDVLVTGVPVDEVECAAFVDELRVAQPRLRVIELVDDDDAFAFSLPGSEHAGRVGRSSMARTLVQAVAQELNGAWPS